ncbi:MAG: thiamine ABC transporter substrate binding subunit [Anaerolineales bacterium]|jgi:thiamine transport system substrate-binding protein
MKKRIFSLFPVFVLTFTACSASLSSERQTTIPEETRTLSVMTHDSFAISEDVLNNFQDMYNVKIKFLSSGDTGSAVNKAVLSKNAPLADVFFGVDNTFLSRALEEDIFEQYNSPNLDNIPDSYKLDPQNRALPIDFGDVCLNYDINYFAENDLEPPETLEDLLKSDYQDLLIVENPATSSPGLAFLFATIGHFGTDEYLDYWQGLVDNGLKVVNDWETAYYSEFSRWGGQYPIVVSYGSSPAFEVIFAENPIDEPPTAAVTSDGSCFRQIEFVGILRGTKNRDLAEKFIDFMLSPTFQEDIPLQMFVFPVVSETKLDPTFVKYLSIPDNPVNLNPADIAVNRENWINAWTDIVLR